MAEPASDAITRALGLEVWTEEPTGTLQAAMTPAVSNPTTRSGRCRSVRRWPGLLHQRIARLQRRVNVSLAISVLGLVIVSALGSLIIRDITGPLGELATTARAIESGEFDATVTVERRRDEIGRLALALRRMLTAQRQG